MLSIGVCEGPHQESQEAIGTLLGNFVMGEENNKVNVMWKTALLLKQPMERTEKKGKKTILVQTKYILS